MRIYVRHEPSKWRTFYYRSVFYPQDIVRVAWLDCVAYHQHIFNEYREN